MHFLLGMLVGFVVGAFTPAVGRYIKGFFVKEATSIESKLGKHS